MNPASAFLQVQISNLDSSFIVVGGKEENRVLGCSMLSFSHKETAELRFRLI